MSYDNIYFEPNLVSKYQKEYLDLVNYYSQVTRNSIFLKYYNINMTSVYEDKLFSTFDKYNSSNILFDIYEFTPAFFSQAVSNRSTYDEMLAGDMMKGVSNIVTTTINRPRINDLITFYPPIKDSNEIFQVNDITTASNMIHSMSKINWFELDLEYAPIEDLSILNIKNHYIYDLSIEDYILLSEYKEKTKILNDLNDFLILILPFYNKVLDIYLNNDKIPLALNDILFLIKYKYIDKYNNKLLLKYPTPYGFLNYHNRFEINPYINITSQFNNIFQIYNISTSLIEEYIINDLLSPQTELEQLIAYGYTLKKFI